MSLTKIAAAALVVALFVAGCGPSDRAVLEERWTEGIAQSTRDGICDGWTHPITHSRVESLVHTMARDVGVDPREVEDLFNRECY